MIKSINQPWAISEKYATRYGELWTNLDFVFENKISEENFKNDPMNITIGELHIAKQQIPLRYKDLITYSKAIDVFTNNMYAERVSKNDEMHVAIKGREFSLRKHELTKLNETLSDALETAMRAYELGLYL